MLEAIFIGACALAIYAVGYWLGRTHGAVRGERAALDCMGSTWEQEARTSLRAERLEVELRSLRAENRMLERVIEDLERSAEVTA